MEKSSIAGYTGGGGGRNQKGEKDFGQKYLSSNFYPTKSRRREIYEKAKYSKAYGEGGVRNLKGDKDFGQKYLSSNFYPTQSFLYQT